MFSIYLLTDIVVAFALLGLGLTVLLKNSRSELNKIFALFAAFVSIWIIANYISNDTKIRPQSAVIANYLVFFFSYSSAVYLLRFAIALANDIKAKIVLRKLYVLLLLIGVTALTPLVVEGVKIQGAIYGVTFGPLALLYFLTLISVIMLTIYLLLKNIKHSKGLEKARLKVLLISLCLTLPFLLLTEFILPVATGWFGLSNVGTLSMLILVYGLFYGVVKHHLFDLRLVIVRSLAYVITLIILSASYGLLSFYITKAIPKLHNNTTGVLLQSTLIIGIILAYAPSKSAFDRLTNRLFYRDAYDPQLFLDQLNQALARNIELEVLLEKSSQIITSNLKSEYCSFGIKEANFKDIRIFGTQKINFNFESIVDTRHINPYSNRNIIVADYLPPEADKIKEVLLKNNIAVLIRLLPEFKSAKDGIETLGYLVLGQKRSGNAYTSEDIKIIGIVTNELVIAIQNALQFDEIQRFNITLQQKVDDATRKLRKTNQRLEELDETKDDFISMASHQLRTPLTSVKGYLSMVLEGDAGKINAIQAKMLHQAFFSSQRMVYLITDLLNVSRLKTGKFIIEPESVNLSEVVEEEVGQLVETAQAKGVELTYNKPTSFPALMLDNTKIRQVIMNFMDNAIYYTPSGGHIRVELNNKPLTVELKVIDDGIGVPRSEQHHLFTKFYRAHNAQKARPDGTGLGLFMAKKVIIAQNGTTLFSSKEGEGSTFGFAFSKSRLAVSGAATPKPVADVSSSISPRSTTPKALTPVK